jgi:MFS family permease
MLYYYALSVLLSAFLLFQIQPMIGKFILPWFGGTPTVWSTVLLFFQALLTAGYAYAYWLLGRLRDRLQGIVHLVLIGISLVLLLLAALTWPSPLTPDASWQPQGNALPVWGIFRVLAVSVGIPYFLLSSNSTLMQAWFGRDDRSQAPYRLYALSNLGSLVALISYPILFEPNLTLRAQAYLWSTGYLVFAIVAAYLALRTYQRTQTGDKAQGSTATQPGEDAQPSRGVYALWIALAACASILLISVTSQITQEVAVVPFLWILPLTIYLLSFILAFSGGRWYSRRLYLMAFFVISAVSVWMLVKWPPFSILTQIVVYALLLFVCCMICHGELFKLRPHPRFLPSFYLMTALGGAMGGIVATLLAPYLFSSGFWELQWGFIACGVLLTVVMQSERAPAPRSRRAESRRKRQRRSRHPEAQQRRTVQPVVILSTIVVLLLSAAIVLIMREISSQTLLATRSFYGVSRVWEINTETPGARAYQLTHGKTVHGFQFATSELRDVPTTFYAENSGVGLAILNHPVRPGELRIGALGMGIGVIASYGQPGDVFRFYEINPDVIRIAEGEGGYFSYLADSQAEVQIIPGDARVSLESELLSAGSQQFDLLVLDAFSGDTIPLHLLTKEAFEIFLEHLKQDGIMAINVSNRYFDLYLEGYRLADEFDLATALIEDRGDGIQSYDSIWMLLTREPDVLEVPAIADRSVQRPAIPASVRLWTDDYSNLLQILR